MKNYVTLHLHTDASNFNMVEVINDYEEYVNRAVELGMKAIAFTEHGNLINWYKKKTYAEKRGLKYIHAVEAYVTWTLDAKLRDNYHTTLIARNYEGFKELNKLVSKSFNRKDGSFYYAPRITWEDIKGTSDNIIILTACLGGMLWQTHKNKEHDKSSEMIGWMVKNKHRVFLEVQNHYHLEQIQYNKMLANIADKTGMKLVGAGDFHAVDRESDEARKILQKAKKIKFSDEDSWELHMKGYDELFESFMKQGIWKREEVEEFLEQTNVIADMVEEFELDYSKKYPKLHDNSDAVLEQKIAQGIKHRAIDKLPHHEKIIYAERIKHELETYRANEAPDYLLLEDEVKSYARKKGVYIGFGRGSVSGSEIAYLMQITEMDSIKRGLNFERFMNKERISLADIDSDYAPSQRHLIHKFLVNHPKLNAYPIMTSNTIALKGAIRDIGRGLEMSLSEVDEIAKNVEENESYYRNQYPELFKYVDKVIGTIVSIGSHACGWLVTDKSIDPAETMGLITTKDSEYPLTMLNMKELDAQNYVKLDILGLDTTEIIGETCRLAGIPFVTPQTLDSEDADVWNSIIEDNVAVFQWESDFAHQVYKDLFSQETIARIKAQNPNFSYMDLFSLGNAILRPSGASYRESVMRGEFYDNGHEALNEFLAPTLGRLVYQEQLMEFLVRFCGYTGGQADGVRRGIGKKIKEVIDTEVPKIEAKFIDAMVRDYGLTHEEAVEIAKPFMQVFLDSADYGFSVNHSDAYSWMGYACAWLRYYYPLEFLTASLNVNIGKEDKTNRLVEYAKAKGIEIKPIKFRFSKSQYAMDKETNAIYQGIYPVKFLNENVADGLYGLRDNKYETFVDLLMDIKDGAKSVRIGSSTRTPIYEEVNMGNIALFDSIKLTKTQMKKFEAGETVKVKICDDINVSWEDAIEMSYKDFLLHEIDDARLKELVKYEGDGAIELIMSEPIAINSKQMKILISLNFFSEFGGNKKLLQIFEQFEQRYKASHKFKTKRERYAELLEFEANLSDESLTLVEQAEVELEYLGHVETVETNIPKSTIFVTDLIKNKSYTRIIGYQFATGLMLEIKVGAKIARELSADIRDVLVVKKAEAKPKMRKGINGWEKHPTDKELWGKELQIIRKGSVESD